MLKLVILLVTLFVAIDGDETICTINGLRALHEVNDKFLGISIDPAVLLTGLNLSDDSLKLARHLSPAFIRIAGPSTKFVKYVDNEENKSSEHLLDDASNVVVTPSMWFGINEWLSLANLTPVFGINDDETSKGAWNPKATLPLLEISDKFNVSCYWQLGYDCSNKTELQYKEDLMVFRNVLDAFPERSNWKIIGSDLTRCIDNDPIETPQWVLADLNDVITAIMWEPENKQGETIFLEDPRISSPPRNFNQKIWTMAPKNTHPVSFSSAILWAKEMGEAARIGYDVIFRQLRVHEIFSVTPAYWVSLLFKTLMGRNVLEVKTNFPQNDRVSIYAHCTKKQNSFVRRGALTVMVINNATTNHTTLLRFGNPYLKNTEVQSYILTAPSEQSTEVYLNHVKLGPENLEQDSVVFTPQLRRAKILNYLSLALPAKSIGFFVLPAAQLPVCVNDEEEMGLLMEEIQEDQNIHFTDEVSVDINTRSNFRKSPTLQELKKMLEDELHSDEKYYSHNQITKLPPNNKITTKKNDASPNNFRRDYITKEARNFFIEMAKKKPALLIEHKKPEKKEEETHHQFNLELTSAEIRRVLSDRAKARAARKNIMFTSAELDELMKKATEKFLKNSHTTIKMAKAKRSTIKPNPRDKKDINMRRLKLKTLGDKRELLRKQIEDKVKVGLKKQRNKRDINMDLLKIKTEALQHNKSSKRIKSKFENNEERRATLRKSGELSDEIPENDDVDDDGGGEKSDIPDGDIFAGFASNEDVVIPTENPLIKFLKPKNQIFNNKPFSKLLSTTRKPLVPFKSKSKHTETNLNDNIQILTASDEFESDLEENQMPQIHEFYNLAPVTPKNAPVDLEMWETIPEKKKPNFTNRNFEIEDEISGFLSFLDKTDQKFEPYDSLEDDYHDLDARDKIRFKRDQEDDGSDRIFFNTGKPHDEVWRQKQLVMLKNRMAHKKKLDMMNRYHKMKHHQRHRRSLLDFDNFVAKNYEALTDNLVWKPVDILNLTKIQPVAKATNVIKQSATLKTINDSPIFKIFVGQNNIQKHKRSVDPDVSQVAGNEIDAFMNEIVKEGSVEETGDYQLIFPNKDIIKLTSRANDLGLKFEQHKDKNVQKIPPKSDKNKEDNAWTKLMEDIKGYFNKIAGQFISYLGLNQKQHQ